MGQARESGGSEATAGYAHVCLKVCILCVRGAFPETGCVDMVPKIGGDTL